jgi:hypothetical protein
MAPRTTAGFELDLLPYVSGGYYVSGWIGHDRIRVRPVVTKTTLPSFVVQDGFTNAGLDAYALIVDYFPRGVSRVNYSCRWATTRLAGPGLGVEEATATA